jgi:hypothetical protein
MVAVVERYNVVDDQGTWVGWFDAAQAWSWDVTEGVMLWRTAARKWVRWERGVCQFVDDEAAAELLALAGVTREKRDALLTEEDERGRGRPSIGGRLTIKLGEERKQRVEQWAADHGLDVSESIRELLDWALRNKSGGREPS